MQQLDGMFVNAIQSGQIHEHALTARYTLAAFIREPLHRTEIEPSVEV